MKEIGREQSRLSTDRARLEPLFRLQVIQSFDLSMDQMKSVVCDQIAKRLHGPAVELQPPLQSIRNCSAVATHLFFISISLN
jgi:hypothetical protein